MDASKDKASVLFVCMGNICRSPLAEGAFRHLVAQGDDIEIDITIDSAGTHNYHTGEPADPRAIAAARRCGIDISMLRARTVSERDFEEFDLVVAMDRDNHALLSQQYSHGANRLRLFMHYAGEDEADVPDPYYGGEEGFELALDLIERGAQSLLAELLRR